MKKEKMTKEELEELRELKELEEIAKKEGIDTIDLETAEINNIEMGKCPKCGSFYLLGSTECYKCHTKLDPGRKACPKCAKYNKTDALKCVNCGYVFGKKNRSIFINLFISIALVVVLLLLHHFKKDSVIGTFETVVLIAGAIVILIMAHLTLNYGRKQQLKYEKNESNAQEQQILRYRKRRGLYFAFVVGAFAVIVFLIYYFT